MPDHHGITVVVVNWNNAPDTIACLESVRAHDPDVEVIVVDNGSDDGSAEVVETTRLADVLIRSPRNDGFAGGANRGLALALARGSTHVAVLNSDVVVTGPVLTRLAATSMAADGPVAVAPLIVLADDPTTPWFGGGVLERGSPRHLHPRELLGRPPGVHRSEWLSGCCVLAHRDVWSRVGLFDERYFLFFEDCDWSVRARASDVQLLVDSTTTIRHGVSRSFRGPASMLGTFYYARNGLLYRREHRLGGCLRFIRDEVVVPPVRGWFGRGERLPAWPLGWLGALFGVVRSAGGPAPRLVAHVARRRAAHAARHQSKG